MSNHEDKIKAANAKWAQKDSQVLEKMAEEKHKRNRKIAEEYGYVTGFKKTYEKKSKV